MKKTYELIEKMVQAYCDQTETIAAENYKQVEKEMIDALSTYLKDVEVVNEQLGTGKIIEIVPVTYNLDSVHVVVAFDDGVRNFSSKLLENSPIWKLSPNVLLRTTVTDQTVVDTYKELYKLHKQLTAKQKEIEMTTRLMELEAEKQAKLKAEREQKAEETYERTKEKAIKAFDDLLTRPVELSTTDDFYYALGWLTQHIGTVSVAIPDYLQSTFEKHFGSDASPYVVDSKKRTSGGFAYQWGIGMNARLRSKDLGDVPTVLTQYLNPTGKMISNTSFVWDLVESYGFAFGKKQDIEKIKRTIPVQYIDSFEAGIIS